jgi:aminopeptidase YwaD
MKSRRGVIMFEETFAKIATDVSAERAFDHVVSISQFHRIQASPGFRGAAEYCVDRLLDSSPEARVVHYPAETGVKFWSFPSFEEWECKKARLEILSPEHLSGRIADFGDCPISINQRSRSTPPGGCTAEVVYVGDGTSVGDYRGARGRIAICDSCRPLAVYEAAVKAGAAGVILYRQRPLSPLRKGFGVEGARQYTSFWWNREQLFGFVLTPEEGQRIVSYLRTRQARRKRVEAWAVVETETYPGTLEVVTSLIPGTEPREIAVVAHLCHPKPSAGDNASGVAALLETHRVLSNLIDAGTLPRPKYGIRFLLVPEITGAFAFLSRERALRRRLLLGLNLDMVGQKQEITGSTLCIESPPLSAPTFAPYLLESIVRRAFSHGGNPAETTGLASIRLQPTSFSGGSDHAVFSDPTVGVPMPMLLQWPDRFYHTSADTPDKVSPDVLKRIGISAACFAYTCALASEEDLCWIAAVTGRGLRKRAIEDMGRFTGSKAKQVISPQDKARFIARYSRRALKSIERLSPRSPQLVARLRKEVDVCSKCVRGELSVCRSAQAESRSKKKPRPYSNLVVKRLVPGPADLFALMSQLSPSRRARYRRWERKDSRVHMMQTLGLYWANGKRTITEIADLVAAELGHASPSFLKFHFETLAEAGIVEIRTS